MKKIVSFSGGRTSAYLCYWMKEFFGDDVDFVYMDTSAEHPKTYEFIKKVNDQLGLRLTCLQGNFNQPVGVGHTYDVVDVNDLKCDLKVYRELVSKYGTPSVVSGWCTSRMKEDVHDMYCDDMYGEGNYVTWLGIRADEPKRLKNVGKRDDLRYMAEIIEADKEEVLNFWSEQPFDLEIPEWLGNCVFCFKKSNLKLAMATFDEPELLKNWSEMIGGDEVRRLINQAKASMARKGVKKYSRNLIIKNKSFKLNHAIRNYNSKLVSKYIKQSSLEIYRRGLTIDDIITSFDGSTGREIKARIRGSHMIDDSMCSESCEVFVNE
ncbi:MAG: phosphoadenosine phosphosulfate reductase family protein [candidate division Zixibacteria bacterium]|nr:phosphoadenosine phosphosulfate reductase family protein [candidate division Zixibacteria bacterium]